MKLYIMRHGIALPVGGSIQEDTQRPLSPAGKVQVQRVAEGLKRRKEVPAIVLSSPLRRAQETARLAAETLGVSAVETSPVLGPNTSPAGIRTLLASQPAVSGVLLVGHHPDVTLWIAFLAGLDPSVCPFFGTASIAALQLTPDKVKAEFLWFQTSEQLTQP